MAASGRRGAAGRVRAGVLAGALLVATACNTTPPAAPPQGAAAPAPAVPLAEPVTGRGDDPVATTLQGAMLSRRAALAVYAADSGARAELRDLVLDAWPGAGAEPSTVGVLPASALEPDAPAAVGLLPEGVDAGTAAAAVAVLRGVAGTGRVDVHDVLVHDLEITVGGAPVAPDAVRARVDEEGVLADHLGDYSSETRGGDAVFRYTGAVLSDAEVRTVVTAVAAAAGVTDTDVSVTGRGSDQGLRAPVEPAAPADPAPDPVTGHGHA